MTLLYLKAIHVIAMVAWFSALFYIVRLYVYHVEAESRPANEKLILQQQFAIMERRLWYGIGWPAMLATVIFGLWMMIEFQFYKQGWLHIKLLLVLCLVLFHFYCGRIRKNLLNQTNRLTSFQLRLLNEVPTVFLVGIVFIVYLKNFFDGVWGVFVLVCLSIAILGGSFLYRKIRNGKKIAPEKSQSTIKDKKEEKPL